MKIDRVETFTLTSPIDKPHGWSQKWTTERLAVVVKITTADGIVGWGQCGAPTEKSVAHVLETEIAPMLLGEDAFLIEQIWQKVVGSFSPSGVQGMLMQALSGVDMALWDIKARALDMPLWRLLGAKYRDNVPVYASGPLYFSEDPRPERAGEEALKYKEQGFFACKIKIGGQNPRSDIARVAAVRDAVGDDFFIAADANQAYNVHTALRVAVELHKLGVVWFEEPVPCTDLAGYKRIRSQVPIALAGGEVEWTRFGARDLMVSGAIDIIQPDLANSGGFTECRRIAAFADTWGVQYMPHLTSTTPINVAATLHLLAALRDYPTNLAPVPGDQTPMLELHQQQHPIRDSLSTTRFVAVDGYIKIPDGSGLGIEIDEEALKRFVH